MAKITEFEDKKTKKKKVKKPSDMIKKLYKPKTEIGKDLKKVMVAITEEKEPPMIVVNVEQRISNLEQRIDRIVNALDKSKSIRGL